MDENMILQDHTLLYALKDEVTTLSQTVSTLVQSITSMKIDSQLHLKYNPDIPAGISTKISYDKNGLVTGGSSLDVSDIPELPIEKVVNLRKELDNTITESDLNKLKVELTKKMITKGDSVNIAVKGNYDINGLLVDSLDLLPSDIPKLSISKIEGLSDILDKLKTQCDTLSQQSYSIEDNDNITAGTFPKITFDEKGKVINGTKLSINDIPSELISKVNTIESKLASYTSSTVVDGLRKRIEDKIDKIDTSIAPGIYSKVKVNKDGLIVSGDKLTVNDLPELNISNIIGLDEKLRNTISIEQFISINDAVSRLMNSINKIGDIGNLKIEINSKADDKEFKNVKNRVDSLQNLLDKLTDSIPNDSILDQLDYITRELSNLSGRITTIENKMMKN